MGSGNFVLTFRIIINFICLCTCPLRGTANHKPQYGQRSEERGIWMEIIYLYFPDCFVILPDFTRKKFSNQFFTFVGGTRFSEWLKPPLMWMTWYYNPHPPPRSPSTAFDVPLLFQLPCPVLAGAVLPPAALLIQSSPLCPSRSIPTARVRWEGKVGRDLLINAN